MKTARLTFITNKELSGLEKTFINKATLVVANVAFIYKK